MTPYIRDAYRRLRAKHPDAGARTCWQWAKLPDPHSLDWDECDGESVGTAVIEGWDIEARIAEDYEADASEVYGTLSMQWERNAFPNPYFREWHEAPGYDDWHDDVCASPHDDDGAARYYIPPDGVSFDELRAYYRSRGMARHEAYTRALAQMRAMADDCRAWTADRYGIGRYSFAFVTATASLAGVEVYSISHGGASWECDYSKPLDPQLDALVDDAVRECLAVAPNMVATVATEQEQQANIIRAMADNLRAAYRGMAPCSTR